MTDRQDDWYLDAISAKWEDRAVKGAILAFLSECDEFAVEGLDLIETAVFGKRVECPHDCGSLVLPGAPVCWGCEEPIP